MRKGGMGRKKSSSKKVVSKDFQDFSEDDEIDACKYLFVVYYMKFDLLKKWKKYINYQCRHSYTKDSHWYYVFCHCSS